MNLCYSYAEQLAHSSEHILSFMESREKEVKGTTYKQLNEMVHKINECGYFDNLANREEEETPEPGKLHCCSLVKLFTNGVIIHWICSTPGDTCTHANSTHHDLKTLSHVSCMCKRCLIRGLVMSNWW